MASSITLKIGQEVTFTTLVLDAYGASTSGSVTTYTSSDPTVAILANNGSFTPGTIPINSVSTNSIRALKNGEATITVNVDGSIMNTIDVTVNSPEASELEFVFGTPIPS